MSKDNFKWTDELAMWYCSVFKYSTAKNLSEFKALHQPKEPLSGTIPASESNAASNSEPSKPEKDWEILSIRNKITHNIIYPSGFMQTQDNVRFNFSELIHHENYEIHSVKRLSDNEIFSVGDEVAFEPTQKIWWEIDNFCIPEHYGGRVMLARSKDNQNVEILSMIIKNKSQKSKPEKERIAVTPINYHKFEVGEHLYGFNSTGLIPIKKYSAIKQAIEQVLNDEVGILGITVLSPHQPKYTEKDAKEKYNTAITHAIRVIKDFYGGSEYHLPPDAAEIVARLKKLQQHNKQTV